MKKLLTYSSFVAFFVLALAVQTFAQRTITGVVTDAENNEPLIGATILAKGTATGTVTDFDGSYSLDVPADATILVVSYTGYTPLEVEITGNVVNVALAAGTALDEVVVVGYGTVRKSDLTGSVASLKEEDFNQGVIVSSDQLLQGRVPGVNIINNSGQPGGQATVKIRGNNSIRAGANPLYVVDGIPLDGRTAKAGLISTDIGNIENSNPLNFLNPADIASIEVLKDASSAAIYGSRASNGVVLITTKKARAGELQVSFNSNWGIANVLKEYDVLTGDEYRDALSDYGVPGGDGGQSEDAFDAITRTAFTQNYNLSIGAGTENSRIRFSAGIQDVEGVVEETDLIRYSGTLNAQFDLFDDRAGIDFFLVSSHTDENLAPISTDAGFTGNLVGQALQWNPTISLLTNGGAFTANQNNPLVGATTINPLQLLNSHTELAKTTNILGSISPYFKITDKLTYRYRFGINYGTGTTRGAISEDINVQGIEGLGFAGVSNNQLLTNLHTHTLDFNTDVGDNRLTLLVGYEYQKFDFRGFAFAGFGFDDVPAGFDLTNALQNSNNDQRIVGSFADPVTELQSYFARATFGIGERFDITATIRADGSTKFGENNQYGVFPSFAAAWNIKNEAFMAGSEFFDDLKVRVGWGITGNQEFPAASSIDRFGLDNNTGISQENIGNPDLQWEQSTTLNVGLDFAILDYRLTGTIEYYSRVTDNLLLDPFVQEPGPPIRAWRNIDGELVNQGLEIGLNAYLVETDKFGLNVALNLAFLTNELRDYTGPDILTGSLFGQGASGAFVQKHVNGQPLNTYFVRDFQGLSDDGTSQFGNNGEPILTDFDPNADVIAGFTIGITASKFSFSANFNSAFGNQLYNNTAMTVIPITNLGSRNVDAALLEGPVRESRANAITSSSRYIEDGDFIKLSNATVSYDLGDVWKVKNVRLSLTGQNLFVITDYSGFDPEINTVNLRNGVPSSGIEYIPYPSARTILFGISASF